VISVDPVLQISIVAVLVLLALAWIVVFIKTIRDRREDRVQYIIPKQAPSRDASRDRHLPGKQRINARRSRTW
jgi:hypothetical protein